MQVADSATEQGNIKLNLIIIKKLNKMNRKVFTGIAFSLMLFMLISCNTVVQESQSTISVSGIGTVLAQPDMVLIHVSFSHTAPTTREAKTAVERTMQRISQILQEENIEDKLVKTISLNYDIEHEWRNGRMVRIGQRAQQTISITVNDLVNSPERFPSLLDKITAIDRVQVGNIQFDIEDKAELFKQSRELAYQKAFDKAAQYAELSGRKIDRVMTISEAVSRDIAQSRMLTTSNVAFQAEVARGMLADDSFLPSGERGVTSEINVVFLLK